MKINRPFPSCALPLSQNESPCKMDSYENEFDLHENNHSGKTHFHMNGFALRLVLTLRQKATWKWPIKKITKFKIEAQHWYCGR